MDTNETCCGHIVTTNYWKSYGEYEPIRRGLYWYPHGIILGIDFSLEDKLEGEEFRRKLGLIGKDIDLNGGFGGERKYSTVDGTETKVLHVFYQSNFPDRNFSPPQDNKLEYIQEAEGRLIHFWEGVVALLKDYSKKEFSQIKSKKFRKISDWADLGDPKRYL